MKVLYVRISDELYEKMRKVVGYKKGQLCKFVIDAIIEKLEKEEKVE